MPCDPPSHRHPRTHHVSRYITDAELRQMATLAEICRRDRRTWGLTQRMMNYNPRLARLIEFAICHTPRLVEVALTNATPPEEGP